MEKENQPSFEFMDKELPKEPAETPAEVVNMNSNEQVDVDENGFELINKENLDLAIKNLDNGTSEKKVGKLIAEKAREEGEYIFRRWIDISPFTSNHGPEAQKTELFKLGIVLAVLDEDEQRQVDLIMHPEKPVNSSIINSNVVELKNVDVVDESAEDGDEIIGFGPEGDPIYKPDKPIW